MTPEEELQIEGYLMLRGNMDNSFFEIAHEVSEVFKINCPARFVNKLWREGRFTVYNYTYPAVSGLDSVKE